LKSSFGPMSPASIATDKSSIKGSALTHNLLCLLGDLDKLVLVDGAVTVSLYETTGSDFLISHFAYSHKSL